MNTSLFWLSGRIFILPLFFIRFSNVYLEPRQFWCRVFLPQEPHVIALVQLVHYWKRPSSVLNDRKYTNVLWECLGWNPQRPPYHIYPVRFFSPRFENVSHLPPCKTWRGHWSCFLGESPSPKIILDSLAQFLFLALPVYCFSQTCSTNPDPDFPFSLLSFLLPVPPCNRRFIWMNPPSDVRSITLSLPCITRLVIVTYTYSLIPAKHYFPTLNDELFNSFMNNVFYAESSVELDKLFTLWIYHEISSIRVPSRQPPTFSYKREPPSRTWSVRRHCLRSCCCAVSLRALRSK